MNYETKETKTSIESQNEVDEFLDSINEIVHSNDSNEDDVKSSILETIAKHYNDEYQKLISENKDLEELMEPSSNEETSIDIEDTLSFIFGKRLDDNATSNRIYSYLNILTKDGFNRESLEHSFDYFYSRINEFNNIEATLFSVITYELLLTDEELNISFLLKNVLISKEKELEYDKNRQENKEFVKEFFIPSLNAIYAVEEYKDIANILNIYRYGIGYGDIDMSLSDNIGIANELLRIEELKENKLVKPFKEIFKIN